MSPQPETKKNIPQPRKDFSELLIGWMQKQPVYIKVTLLVFTVLFAAAAVYTALNVDKTCAVEVNGKVVAFAENEGEARAALNCVLEEKSGQLGGPARVAETVEFRNTNKVKARKVINKDELKKILAQNLNFLVDGAAIKVNGETKFVFTSKAAAEDFIAKVKDFYAVNDSAKVEFIDQVKIVEEPIDPDRVLDEKTAMTLVDKGVKKVEQYVVKSGDTLWDIAMENHVTLEELQEANPNLKSEIIQVGQVLDLTRSEPVIHVRTTYEETVQKSISPPVQVKYDSNKYKGLRTVLDWGKAGLKEVTYRVTEQNNVEVGRTVINEKILQKPTPRIVLVGTKFIVASRGSGEGRLNWPTSGSLSSPYGMRHGRMHYGIDIANKTGTPVYAAAAGQVIRAGWYYNYGLTVDIDHGNGLMTRYGHLSSINVKYGDKVKNGQLIGKMGNTGYSTGPHLHFEVRVNGKPRNPMSYLD